MSDSNSPKKTALYEKHVKNKAKMVLFAGFWMPLQYQSIAEEHRRVRSSVGIFDVSHMGEIIFRGQKAGETLQRIVTNDILSPPNGKAIYTPVCLENGGIVDDMIVYKFSTEEYFICVNAANKDKDFLWFLEHAEGKCEVLDQSDMFAQIAVQGPKSPIVMGRIFGSDIENMKAFTFREETYSGEKIIVATTGYTGERGWEIYLPTKIAGDLWDDLISKGDDLNICPVGLGARDTLRLEMNYCLYGSDIDETTTPLEAGIEWTVKFGKGDFIGRDALLKQKEEGLKRHLVPFVMEDKGIPRHGYTIFVGDEKVGYVTSGTMSPTLEKGVGMGYIATPFCEKGNRIQIDMKGLRRASAQVVEAPIYRPKS